MLDTRCVAHKHYVREGHGWKIVRILLPVLALEVATLLRLVCFTVQHRLKSPVILVEIAGLNDVASNFKRKKIILRLYSCEIDYLLHEVVFRLVFILFGVYFKLLLAN